MRKLILRILGYRMEVPQQPLVEAKQNRKHEDYKAELRRAHLLAKIEEKHGYVPVILERMDRHHTV